MATISSLQQVNPPPTISCNKSKEHGKFEICQYVLYPQRWFTLVSFSILSCSSSWMWITWAPLARSLTTFWDVPLSAVDDLSGVYFYVYVPVSFLSLYLVVNRLGLRRGLILAAILNSIGAWIRYRYFQNYQLVYIGTFICALAQTFTLSSPPLIAGNWFGEEERATSTAIGVLANQLGTAFGLGTTVVVDFFVNSINNQSIFISSMDVTTTATEQEEKISSVTATKPYEEQVLDANVLQGYLKFQLVHALIAFVAVAIFVGDVPPTPPSFAASLITRHSSSKTSDEKSGTTDSTISDDSKASEKTQLLQSADETGSSNQKSCTQGHESTYKHHKSPSYVESVILLFQNLSSVLFAVCFGLGVGVYYTLPPFLSQLFPSQSPRSVGFLGLFYQVVGIFGSIVAGRVMDVTQGHRRIALCSLIGSCFFLVLSSLFVGDNLPANNDINCTLFGLELPYSLSSLSWIAGAASIGLTGVFLSAFNTVGIELGTGMVFPADESAIAGILESAAELGGFVMVTIGGSITSSFAPTHIDSNINNSSDDGIEWIVDSNNSRPSTTDEGEYSFYLPPSSGSEKELLLMLATSVAMAVLILLTIRTDMTRPSTQHKNNNGNNKTLSAHTQIIESAPCLSVSL